MFTYDPSTLVGQVRLLISDRFEASPIFQDEDIQAFLGIEGDVPRLGAALGLEIIAGNEVFVQKRIKMLDLSTDGPAEATALLAVAARFRESEVEMAAFDTAEMVGNQFTARERLWKQYQRQAFP